LTAWAGHAATAGRRHFRTTPDITLPIVAIFIKRGDAALATIELLPSNYKLAPAAAM
jgi:hypothetical protein